MARSIRYDGELMSFRDRDVALLAGQVREHAANFATCMQRQVGGAVAFRAELIRHYHEFRDRLRSFEQPGVAAVVIDRVGHQVAGVALLAARIGEPNALIAGRHSRTDLLITGDQTVSLRHLAIVVEPLTDLGQVTYRVVDLRSSQGLRTEEGKVLGGVRADGPAFFTAGNYALFFFTTGDPTDWPESAADAWSFIPERVYLEERPQVARGSARRPAVAIERPITLIQGTGAPSRIGRRLLRRGERAVAELTLTGAGGSRRVQVGDAALADGVLIGRSDRCDASAALRDPSLSRVHMLLITIGERTYALDTASTNGSYLAGDPDNALELRALEPGDVLDLAGVARVTWQPR